MPLGETLRHLRAGRRAARGRRAHGRRRHAAQHLLQQPVRHGGAGIRDGAGAGRRLAGRLHLRLRPSRAGPRGGDAGRARGARRRGDLHRGEPAGGQRARHGGVRRPRLHHAAAGRQRAALPARRDRAGGRGGHALPARHADGQPDGQDALRPAGRRRGHLRAAQGLLAGGRRGAHAGRGEPHGRHLRLPGAAAGRGERRPVAAGWARATTCTTCGRTRRTTSASRTCATASSATSRGSLGLNVPRDQRAFGQPERGAVVPRAHGGGAVLQRLSPRGGDVRRGRSGPGAGDQPRRRGGAARAVGAHQRAGGGVLQPHRQLHHPRGRLATRRSSTSTTARSSTSR